MPSRVNALKVKVLHILERYPDTRNSDVVLTLRLWMSYHDKDIQYFEVRGEKVPFVRLKSVLELPREDHVARVRRVIQNEERKFLPTSWEVAKQRGFEEEQWRRDLGYNPEMRQAHYSQY